MAKAGKARLAVSTDLKERDRQLADLQASLRVNNTKLAETQQTHVLFVRKSPELDDERREVDLTV